MMKLLSSIAKNIITLAIVCSSIASANARDLRVVASTVGPDRYADGTMARVDEYYALVWIKDGYSFKGFKRDVALVDQDNNKIVSILPLAKHDKNGNAFCPTTLYIIAEKLMPQYDGGSFMLVMLNSYQPEDQSILENQKYKFCVSGWVETQTSGKYTYSSTGTKTYTPIRVGTTSSTKDSVAAYIDVSSNVDTNAIIKKVCLDNRQNIVFLVSGTSKSRFYGIAAGPEPDKCTSIVNAGSLMRGRRGNLRIKIPIASCQNYYRLVSYSEEELSEDK